MINLGIPCSISSSPSAEIFVPEIADYEVRRELIRSGQAASVSRLDRIRRLDKFLPITTDDMRKRLGQDDFVYEIACAQLCGLGHYSMRGYVTIDSQEGFQAWLDAEGKKLNSEDAAWN